MNLTPLDWVVIPIGMAFVGGGFVICLVMPILMLFFPKQLEKSVMCEPYFTEPHAEILRHFPYTLTRATVISCSIAWYWYGDRYNGLTEPARKNSPLWYLFLTYTLIWLGVVPGSVGLLFLTPLHFMGHFDSPGL